MSEEQDRKTLLTADGKGVKAKEEALARLLGEEPQRPCVCIEYDEFAEDPLSDDLGSPWELHSFNRRDRNYSDPMEKGWLDENGAAASATIGEMFGDGRAFILSHYEHGNRMWFLQDEHGTLCPFDGTRIAGLLMPREGTQDMPEGYEKRVALARALLKEYTSYINGEVYAFNIEDQDGNELKDVEPYALGGYTDECLDKMKKDIRDALPPGTDMSMVGIRGQCAYLLQLRDLVEPELATTE